MKQYETIRTMYKSERSLAVHRNVNMSPRSSDSKKDTKDTKNPRETEKDETEEKNQKDMTITRQGHGTGRLGCGVLSLGYHVDAISMSFRCWMLRPWLGSFPRCPCLARVIACHSSHVLHGSGFSAQDAGKD